MIYNNPVASDPEVCRDSLFPRRYCLEGSRARAKPKKEERDLWLPQVYRFMEREMSWNLFSSLSIKTRAVTSIKMQQAPKRYFRLWFFTFVPCGTPSILLIHIVLGVLTLRLPHMQF